MRLEHALGLMGCLTLLAASACAELPGEGAAAEQESRAAGQALVGCTAANAVPLQGPNVANRLGANACVTVIPPFLPPWWQFSDGTLRVQIADFPDGDSESAFPLNVQWENTCGTEQGTASYPIPWQQRALGHPSSSCSILIKLGGPLTEEVRIFWGA